MLRYAQITPIIEKVRPRTIVEIGTHRGSRARMMTLDALKWRGSGVSYLGFDVFETMDERFQAAALNGKGIAAEHDARAMLSSISNDNPGFTWELVVGDTRETLRDRKIVADLVFIDGDHRVDAIRSDYAAVRESRCVIFDDYLVPGHNGQLPDLDVYGANRVVDAIPGAKVLPATDYARQGWGSRCAVVMRR